MNQMSTISAWSNRPKRALLVCAGILLWTACFFAGRISVQPTNLNVGPNAANYTVSVPTNSGESAVAARVTSGGRPKTKTASKSSLRWSEQRWSELMSKPGTVARNKAMAELLEKLAATDPKRAMALAQAEGNLKLRASLEQAVLRGWATTAPADASKWVLALSNQSDRSTAMQTVFDSAVATNPDEAVRVAKLVMQQAGGDMGYGTSLIDSLCDAGNFDIATKFAVEDGVGQRPFLLGEAYSKWAELQPEEAAQAANAIDDPEIRDQALQGVVGGWAEADPAALTQFLSQLSPDDDRGLMLSRALKNWVRLDPAAAADWINNSDMGADLDQGIKAVASMDLGSDSFPPTVAVNWAESINNPTLRSEALMNVLSNWASIDLSAATSYFNTTANLLPADRQQIGQIIAGLSSNAAQ